MEYPKISCPFTVLFGALVGLVFVQMTFSDESLGRVIIDILFTLTVSSALLNRHELSKEFRFLLVPIFITLLLRWSWLFLGSNWLLVFAGGILESLVLFALAALIMLYMWRVEKCTFDTLVASGVAYFLIGYAFAGLYRALAAATPGAFHLPEFAAFPMTEMAMNRTLTYFSFVTLTGVGYGDAAPVSQVARTVTLLEAVVSYFYAPILVAYVISQINIYRAEAKEAKARVKTQAE